MARLPTPGSDDGVWGSLLNDFLAVEHNNDGTLKSSGSLASTVQKSTVTTKGDLLVATGSGAITRLPVGSNDQILTADSSQSSGVKWAAAPAGAADTTSAYPISGYGFFAASENISAANGAGALDQAWFVRVFVPAGKAITAIAGFSRG